MSSLATGSICFAPASATATITVTGVDGASNFALATEGSAAIKVYGGTAGECTGDLLATSTCDSCLNNNGSAVASVRLTACNNTRIHANLQLNITFSSDSAAKGKPIVTNSDGTDLWDMVGSPGAVIKGQTTTVTILWSEICTRLEGDAECDTETALTGSLRVGLDTDNNGAGNEKLNDAADDYKTIDIVVQKTVGQGAFVAEDSATYEGVSIHAQCGAGTQVGVCYFSVNPGDEKVTIKDLDSDTLPDLENLEAKAVRFYYSPEGFREISPATKTYVDLPLDPSSTESQASLSSDRILGLENETLYYFKNAVVDLANNVGYFTPDALDVVCRNGAGEIDNNIDDCHVAKPGKVLGVLSEDVNCFIATAAYGSPMAKQVETFRQFRNAYLLPYGWGRAFIRTYYRFGPKVAEFIADQEWLRAGARLALTPALWYATLSLKLGVGMTTALFSLFASAPLLCWFAWSNRRRFAKARISGSRQPR